MKSDLELLYNKKSDDELILIVNSPLSYRAEALETAQRLLAERGVSEDTINAWRDPSAEFVVSAWHRNLTESALKRKFILRRLLYIVPLWLFLAYWTVMVLNDRNFSFAVVFIIPINYLCLAFFRSLFFGIFFGAPLRILLLRPFMFSQNRKQLRYFGKNYLRYLGHTYTIADSEIKSRRSFFEVFSYFSITPMLILFARYVKPNFNVRYYEDIPKLKVFLSRRIARNIAWALSWDKLFKISCTAESWKFTVQNLINSAQVVIIDLSNIGEGLKWETEELSFYNSLGKLLIITHKDRLARAQDFVKLSVLSGYNNEIFAYDDKGILINPENFTLALASAANWSFTADQSDRPEEAP